MEVSVVAASDELFAVRAQGYFKFVEDAVILVSAGTSSSKNGHFDDAGEDSCKKLAQAATTINKGNRDEERTIRLAFPGGCC